MKTIDEIREFFDKHNIEIALVFVPSTINGEIQLRPELEMTFEQDGQHIYLDHFWEGRIKAYNLIPPKDRK